jgi:predicted dehydrogenase
VTALVALLGSVTRATGSARIPFPEKRIEDPMHVDYGKQFAVEIPTNVSGILDFEDGWTATVTTTTEMFGYSPRLEIYGTEGILRCPDPNIFGGPVILQRKGAEALELPLTHSYNDRNRGLGVADMAYALRRRRPHRASAELLYHVHDVMHAIHEASEMGQHVQLDSRVDRPAPMLASVDTNVLL